MSALVAKYFGSVGGDQISLGVAGSLLAHVLLVAAVIFWPAGGSNNRVYFAPTYNVRLLSAAPAPPPVAAKPAPKPAAVLKPKPKPVAAPAPKPKAEPIAAKKKAKPKAKPKPKRIKPKVNKAAEAAKAEQELARRMAQLKKRTQARRTVDSALSRIAGRVASRGRAAAGVAGSAGSGGGDKTSRLFAAYHTQVWQLIRAQWIVPEALIKSTRGLETVLLITIRRDGTLSRMSLEKSSGNSRFDQTALRAAKKAGPYPRLPAGYRRGTYEMGVRFRPEDHR